MTLSRTEQFAQVRGSRSVRHARGVVIGSGVLSVLLMLWDARHQYFVWDEWAFWTYRLPLLQDHDFSHLVMRPELGHWNGVTMIVWSLLYPIFGVKVYLPYLVPVLVVNAVAGWVLFEVLRVLGLRIWICAATAVLFLGLGAAAGNTFFGWGICFVVPIAAIYVGMWAAERRSRSWDVVAVLCVTAGVMASNVGLTALVVVGACALARKRWVMLGGLAFPALLYLAWRQAYNPETAPVRVSRTGTYLSYVLDGLHATVEGIFRTPVAWVVVAAAVVVAVRVVRQYPTFLISALGAVVFYASVSTQRGAGLINVPADAPRYVHLAAALLLPSVALLADQLVSWRRWTVPVLVVVWAVLFATNVVEHARWNDDLVATSRKIRTEIEATVALGPALDDAPADATPFPRQAFGFNIGRLRAMRDQLPCSTDHPQLSARMAEKIGVDPPAQLTCD